MSQIVGVQLRRIIFAYKVHEIMYSVLRGVALTNCILLHLRLMDKLLCSKGQKFKDRKELDFPCNIYVNALCHYYLQRFLKSCSMILEKMR